ncbi:MAG: aminotransferase class I/II-fold pyridoxal phosphate-dependent enzyme [Acidimicrobiia bacterium]|nr:aminotransferase class I/II-fold pyridoxal phosphate-dependent enzyme [Acidimicrobiia bacterium]MYF83780.1 aminotransferase class I/II-fold pyridoxal phosphate-dependent enzyme [Acidimicrobiia bacterium]
MDLARSQRLDALPPYVYVEIHRLVAEARRAGRDVIDMGKGDPDTPTPSHVVAALRDAAQDPVNHQYPLGLARGLPEFRAAISAWYKRRFDVHVDPETEVLPLMGSKEGNLHFCLGALDPGDLVLVPDPAFPAYEAAAILAGAEVRKVPLLAENGFLIDFDSIPRDVAARARAIWMSYPNNPTAVVAPVEFYEMAVDFAQRTNTILVSDNPYADITFGGEPAASVLTVDGAKDVAVEFNSLSKSYNMTGWRSGMVVGNPDVVGAVRSMKLNTDAGLFGAVQKASIAALETPDHILSTQMDTYRRRRDRVVTALRRIGLAVEPPQGTFYVWAPLPDGTSSMRFFTRLLEETAVVAIPGIGYGRYGEGYVRFSLTVPDARLDEAMDRVEAAGGALLHPPTGRP